MYFSQRTAAFSELPDALRGAAAISGHGEPIATGGLGRSQALGDLGKGGVTRGTRTLPTVKQHAKHGFAFST